MATAARKGVERPAEGAGPRLPDFVVIGAQRSGTSYLALNLRQHPGIYMASRKELHFFTVHFDRGLDWYRRQFADAAPGQVAGEATPLYVYFGDAIERMARAIPDARLIVTLRNPVDRAYSHWLKERTRGREDLSFEEALAAEPERLRGGDIYDSRKAYADRGRYLPQLERVARLYPRSSLHVVIFEEMRAEPTATYQQIFSFLGVDDSFVSPNLATKAQAYRTLRSRSLHRALSKLPRGRARRSLQRLNYRRAPAPPMDPATRARLLEDYREQNAALASWLGRDLDRWDR